MADFENDKIKIIPEEGSDQTKSLLASLSDEQAAAVMATGENIYVKSVPGSGKTATLVAKVAYLIEKKICKPEEVRCITFTQKAAQELKERLARYLGQETAKKVKASTFHSFAREILINNSNISKVTTMTAILSDEVAGKFFPSVTDADNLKTILSFISKAKDLGKKGEPDYEAAYSTDDKEFSLEELKNYYRIYEEKKAAIKAIDYSDMMIMANKLLGNENIATKERIYKHLMVDEYQDSNIAQLELVDNITDAGKACRISLFGDDDQSIYRWRGAAPEASAKAAKDFGCLDMKLTKSFRCDQSICDAASSLMGANTSEQCRVHMHNDTTVGEKPSLIGRGDREGELSYIARKIKEENKNGRDLSSIVIQARTNAEIAEISSYLEKEGIEVSKLNRTNPYSNDDFRTLFSYLNVASNMQDADAVFRMCSYWNLDENDLKMAVEGVNLSQIIKSRLASEGIDKARYSNLREPLSASYAAFSKGEKVGEIIKGFYDAREKTNAKKLSAQVTQLFDKTFSEMSVKEAFEKYNELSTDKNIVDESGKGVKVSTMHGVKGLEWDLCFVTGMSKNNYDKNFLDRSGNINRNLYNEEKNLFYVALTRAKKQCIITFNTQNGDEVSSFVEQIGSECLNLKNAGPVFIPSKMVQKAVAQDNIISRVKFPTFEKESFKPRYVYEETREKEALEKEVTKNYISLSDS